MKKRLRKNNWLPRLNWLIEKSMDRPFVWGQWDCALWAAAAVKAMTGKDFAKPFRGKYDSAASAAVALKKHGPGSLYKVMRSNFGNPISSSKGRRGDIAYYNKSLGVCYGPNALFVGGHMIGEQEEKEGLILIPVSQITHVFKVR